MYKVLVDTCIWSEVLRRKAPDTAISTSLAKLLRDLRAVLIGPVRQEILSGISDDEKFEKLKKLLSCLPDAPIATSDYELAAQYANMCRRKGIQGSAIDFLICAVAVRNDLAIYTVDKDFEHYRTVIPITLWVEK
mgnify:FL=1